METLVEQLNALCEPQPFHTGWHVRDLRTGWCADRNGDVVVPSASTRKVAILMAALKEVHEGRLSLDERMRPDSDLDTTSGCFQWFRPGFELTFYDLLLMMIIVSDNVSTRAVATSVGLPRVQELCDSLGMTGTAHRHAVPDPALPRDYGRGVSNDTTPNDQALLLQAILDGARDEAAAARHFGVTSELCELALDILSKQRLRSRLPAFLPEGTKVANKTGSLGSSFNDVGVVYAGDEPRFIFTAFNHQVPEALPDGTPGRAAVDLLVGRMARLVWDVLVEEQRA